MKLKTLYIHLNTKCALHPISWVMIFEKLEKGFKKMENYPL